MGLLPRSHSGTSPASLPPNQSSVGPLLVACDSLASQVEALIDSPVVGRGRDALERGVGEEGEAEVECEEERESEESVALRGAVLRVAASALHAAGEGAW